MKRLNSIDFNKRDNEREENNGGEREGDSLPNTLPYLHHIFPNTIPIFQCSYY